MAITAQSVHVNITVLLKNYAKKHRYTHTYYIGTNMQRIKEHKSNFVSINAAL